MARRRYHRSRPRVFSVSSRVEVPVLWLIKPGRHRLVLTPPLCHACTACKRGGREMLGARGGGVRRSWMDARGASGDAWMEAVWRWWKSTLEKRLSLSLSLVHPVSFYFPFSVTTLPSWSTRRSNKSDVNNVIVGRSGRKRWRHHFILEWRCGWINDVLKRLFRMVESARVDSRKDLEQWDEYPDVTRIPIVVALLWCFRNF